MTFRRVNVPSYAVLDVSLGGFSFLDEVLGEVENFLNVASQIAATLDNTQSLAQFAKDNLAEIKGAANEIRKIHEAKLKGGLGKFATENLAEIQHPELHKTVYRLRDFAHDNLKELKKRAQKHLEPEQVVGLGEFAKGNLGAIKKEVTKHDGFASLSNFIVENKPDQQLERKQLANRVNHAKHSFGLGTMWAKAGGAEEAKAKAEAESRKEVECAIKPGF
jgi:superfamily I DNA/RNA helicase